MTEKTGLTGMPHRPSSSDGYPSLSPLSLAVSRRNPTGLAVQDTHRFALPYRVRLAARTVRRLV